MIEEKVIEWIYAILQGKATLDQEMAVRRWLKEKPENIRIFQDICRDYYRVNYAGKWEKGNYLKAMERVRRHLRFRARRRRLWWGSVAAMVTVCLGTWFLLRTAWLAESVVPSVVQEIPAGKVCAMLTLADGTRVELGASANVSIDLGTALAEQDTLAGLVYHSKKTAMSSDEYNVLAVPRAGEYVMTLSDGSRVWLNSETELKYPVSFCGKKREVWLSGEAYFEVAKDTAHPFIVHTPKTQTLVLGTSFNVMAYQEEKETQVTLVEGAVEVQAGMGDCRILPGYQVQVDNQSLAMERKQVNVDYYVSWKEGLFDFDGMTLDDLCVKLSRWYNVDFFFANPEAGAKRFTGAVKRNNTLQFMLDFIEKTSNVRFEVKGKTVTVYNQ